MLLDDPLLDQVKKLPLSKMKEHEAQVNKEVTKAKAVLKAAKDTVVEKTQAAAKATTEMTQAEEEGKAQVAAIIEKKDEVVQGAAKDAKAVQGAAEKEEKEKVDVHFSFSFPVR